MVLTAYFVLSPVTGFLATVACADIRRITTRLGGCASARLDASVGAPGPHDFAVRDPSRAKTFDGLLASAAEALAKAETAPFVSALVDRSRAMKPTLRCQLRARRCRVHRIPHPTSVTIAIRPSLGTGWRRL